MSQTKKETLDLFLKHLCKFAECLKDRFTEERMFRLCHTSLLAMKTLCPEKCIKFFISYSYKYRDQILQKDEDGLLNRDYMDDIKTLSVEYDGTTMSDNKASLLIKTLKNYWHELDSDERENMWQHLHILIVLTDKYIKEKALSKMGVKTQHNS